MERSAEQVLQAVADPEIFVQAAYDVSLAPMLSEVSLQASPNPAEPGLVDIRCMKERFEPVHARGKIIGRLTPESAYEWMLPPLQTGEIADALAAYYNSTHDDELVVSVARTYCANYPLVRLPRADGSTDLCVVPTTVVRPLLDALNYAGVHGRPCSTVRSAIQKVADAYHVDVAPIEGVETRDQEFYVFTRRGSRSRVCWHVYDGVIVDLTPGTTIAMLAEQGKGLPQLPASVLSQAMRGGGKHAAPEPGTASQPHGVTCAIVPHIKAFALARHIPVMLRDNVPVYIANALKLELAMRTIWHHSEQPLGAR